jgi:hypothetical protein
VRARIRRQLAYQQDRVVGGGQSRRKLAINART